MHTYSGYENKVKDNLEKTVENNGMQDLIFEITVPTEEVAEIRNGKRVTYQRKTFPGYVLVKMIITSESWYVVRNTRGVTGFVGPESKPVALSPEEVELMLNSQSMESKCSIAVGEEVRILSGPLENFTGTVEEIDPRQAAREGEDVPRPRNAGGGRHGSGAEAGLSTGQHLTRFPSGRYVKNRAAITTIV